MAKIIRLNDFKKSFEKVSKDSSIKIEKEAEKVISGFENEYRKLRKQIGSHSKSDFNAQKTSIAMSRALLASILQMLPIAEKQYHKKPGQSTAYSFTALVNLAREIQSDIRNLVDLQKQADSIVDKIVQPSLILIVQNLVNEMYLLRKEFRTQIKGSKSRNTLKSLTDDYLRTQSKYMNVIKSQLSKQVHSFFVENE